MRTSAVFGSAALLGSAVAGLVPRIESAPTDDGFPNPDAEQQKTFESEAFGRAPGTPLPDKLGPSSTTVFQLIAFNEIWESAYFDSLLRNITDEVEGYETDEKDKLIKIISTVLAVSIS